jgi:hypothetical protein
MCLVGSVGTALWGCGAHATYPATARDPGERIVLARATLDRQRTSPWAGEIALDARRAEQWLDQAAARLGRGQADEDVDLLLTTAEGQLSVIETTFARRDAENRLRLTERRSSSSSSSSPSPSPSPSSGGTP